MLKMVSSIATCLAIKIVERFERTNKQPVRVRQNREAAKLQELEEWEKMYGAVPALKRLPSNTSDFARKVYAEVFNSLASYNIRFKTEFNYLAHGLYKCSNASEKGVRADLLVEVEGKDNEKSFTMVIEAQGFQHRPILKQHLNGVNEKINKRCGDVDGCNQSELVEIVKNKNMAQLQHDLAKLLMSLKQDFIHIIVYDVRSVRGAIADALGRKNNTRVYYPSDKENINEQHNDRESIIKLLHQIDSKFRDSNPVKNLTIDFTTRYVGSIKAQQLLITSSFASSNQESLPELASLKKRSRSSSSSSDDQLTVVKKKKRNAADDD